MTHDMRRLGVTGLNLDVRNLKAYPATLKLDVTCCDVDQQYQEGPGGWQWPRQEQESHKQLQRLCSSSRAAQQHERACSRSQGTHPGVPDDLVGQFQL